MSFINLIDSDWYKHLDYEEVSVNAGADSSEYISRYVDAGHHPKTLTLDRCHLDPGLPELVPVIEYFKLLKNVSFCAHRLRPGHYVPTHSDEYAYYTKKFNVDSNNVHRFIVFLEDHQDGHILFINKFTQNSYRAGNVAGWTGRTPHAALNFGLTDRYTLQVTGTK